MTSRGSSRWSPQSPCWWSPAPARWVWPRRPRSWWRPDSGAELGVLFKGGESLERLEKVDAVVLDKTGTITRGKPELTDVALIPDGELSEQDLLRLAASAESASEHPIARAIVAGAQARGVELVAPDEFAGDGGRR